MQAQQENVEDDYQVELAGDWMFQRPEQALNCVFWSRLNLRKYIIINPLSCQLRTGSGFKAQTLPRKWLQA